MLSGMAKRKPNKPLVILESTIRFTKPLRVDREQGVVYGVKVLGWESDNNREYAYESAERAVSSGLYENRKTYANHPEKKNNEQRSVYDLIGKLFNTRLDPDGVFADWKLNKRHELYEAILDDAEEGTGFYGLSHNAEAARWEIRGGKQIVLEIARVFSVDMVSDPATVLSLSESRNRRTLIKLSQLFEACSINPKLPAKKRKLLLEMMDDEQLMEQDPEVMEPSAEAMPEDALKTGFHSAIMQIVTDALDGTVDPKEAKKRIEEFLMSHHKLNGGATEATPTPADDLQEMDEDEEEEFEETTVEGRKGKKGKGLTISEARVKQLCELAGVQADAELLEAATGCRNEDAAIRVIQLAKRGGNKPADNPYLGLSGKAVYAKSVSPSTVSVQEAKSDKKTLTESNTNSEERRKKNLSFLRGGSLN